MRRRLLTAVCSLPLVFTILAVASPAQAAPTAYLYISTKYIAINSNGTASVFAKCSATTTCKGKVSFDDGTPIATSYSLKAKSSGYIPLAMKTTSKWFPATMGQPAGDDIKRVSGVVVKVQETTQKKATHSYTRTADTRLPGSVQQITGTVSGSAGSQPVRDMVVRLFTKVRGGNTQQKGVAEVAADGTFRFDVPMDRNNNSIATYYVKINGVDPHGDERSWWWRGSSTNTFSGGARYLRDASPVSVSRHRDFVADFKYSFITGSIGAGSYAGRSNVDILVASPPPAYYGSNTAAMAELDIERCANVFAHTRTSNGSYRVDFLPATDSSANRYMVGARSGSAEVWAAATMEGTNRARFGSCYDAIEYTKYTRANLMTLPQNAGLDVVVPLTNPTAAITVNRPTRSWMTSSDKYIRIREKVPGLSVMDSPVVAQGSSTSYKLQPGLYWLETGRRTGCSAWYPSVYRDNNAYFKGADRGAERWKTVNGRVEEYKKSVTMGYVRRTPPGNNKGWMYRGYCKARSAGKINTFNVNSSTTTYTANASTPTKGAVVSGKVTRSGGRTNKEMMVRLSNSGGTIVLRTDLTDGGGKFYVGGLASGKYTISVNSDSWRGIGRSFTGKHTITVSAGKSYSVGTLRFNG